jgi:hypothetical protein
MEDTQILSVFQESAPPAPNLTPDALLFDACHVGVVLRAVLFVQTVVGVLAMFGSATPLQWLIQVSLITGAAFPATLLWLIASCGLKKVLARLKPTVQKMAGVGLGALAGLYGCGVLVLLGLLETPPWWASAFAGALLSARAGGGPGDACQRAHTVGDHRQTGRAAGADSSALSVQHAQQRRLHWCMPSLARLSGCSKTSVTCFVMHWSNRPAA